MLEINSTLFCAIVVAVARFMSGPHLHKTSSILITINNYFAIVIVIVIVVVVVVADDVTYYWVLRPSISSLLQSAMIC